MSNPEPTPSASGPFLDHESIVRGLLPRNLRSFWREAMDQAWSSSAWVFMTGWLVFQASGSLGLAFHWRGFAAHSALPQHWGEQLELREVWELLVNGGLRHDPLGALTPLLALAGLLLVFWGGWQMQARVAGVRPALAPWFWGALDVLKLSFLPILLLLFPISWILFWLRNTGISLFGWMAFGLIPFFGLVAGAALNIHWSLARLSRATQASSGWRMGSWTRLMDHWLKCFRLFWGHPVRWFGLALSGVLFRLALQAGVLFLAWRLGGDSLTRVGGFLLLQFGVTFFNACFLAWQLRLIAFQWHHDSQLERERCLLEQGPSTSF